MEKQVKKKFSITTYIKLIIFLLLYFYVLVISVTMLVQNIRNGNDLMNPLLYLIFCAIIPVYAIFGRKGRENPLDKKVGAPVVAALVVVFFAIIGFIFWYSKDMR